MRRIEIIPIISGGVSLGSYEAGIMYSLILSSYIGKVRGDFEIVIPAISGTSAGAITSLISSYILTDGLPVSILYDFWVDLMDVKNLLRNKSERSLFDREYVKNYAKKLLTSNYDLCSGNDCIEKISQGCFREKRCRLKLSDKVELGFSLTSLNGRLEYISKTSKREDIVFSDRIIFTKFSGVHKDEFMDYAIASSSFPIAFDSVKIKRNKNDYPYISDSMGYEFDQEYIDGGVLNNRPVNIGVDLSFKADVKNPLLLIIEPDVRKLKFDFSKFDIKKILYHILITIRSNQPVVKDVRGIEKTNKRISGLNEFYTELAKVIDKLKDKEIFLSIFNEENPYKREMFEELTTDTGTVRVLEGISSFIEKRLSLYNKLNFDVGFIYSNPKRLSGEFMGHFGGFLSKNLRRNDFINGVIDARLFLNRKYGLQIKEFDIEKMYNKKLTNYDLKNLSKYERLQLIKLLVRMFLLFIENKFLRFLLYPIVLILLHIWIFFFL